MNDSNAPTPTGPSPGLRALSAIAAGALIIGGAATMVYSHAAARSIGRPDLQALHAQAVAARRTLSAAHAKPSGKVLADLDRHLATLDASINDVAQQEAQRADKVRALAHDGWDIFAVTLIMSGVLSLAAPYRFEPIRRPRTTQA